MAKKRTPEDDEQAVELDDHEANEDDVEDDEDDDDDDRAARHRKKKKKKRVRIMTKSGQTEADRRLLRRRQRELHAEIAVGGGEGGDGGVGDDDADALTRLRAQNNELWKDVRYTREAVLDSENVDLIASKAAREAEKIVQVSFD
jgi:hypothetical protein